MYFDPGTGSLIVQLFLACVAGFTSFLFVFRNNVKVFFSKFKKTKNIEKVEKVEEVKEDTKKKDTKKTNTKKKDNKNETKKK